MTKQVFFESKMQLPPIGKQRQPTPVYYIASVLTHDPVTGEPRSDADIVRCGKEALNLCLNRDYDVPLEIQKIDEAEVLKLERRSVLVRHDSSVLEVKCEQHVQGYFLAIGFK